MSRFLYVLVYIRPFINLQFFSRHRHQSILPPNLILHLPPSSDLARHLLNRPSIHPGDALIPIVGVPWRIAHSYQLG